MKVSWEGEDRIDKAEKLPYRSHEEHNREVHKGLACGRVLVPWAGMIDAWWLLEVVIVAL